MEQRTFETSHQMGDYPKIVISLLLGFFPALGISLLFLGLYASYVSIVYDGYPVGAVLVFLLFVIGVSTYFLMLGWAFISSGLARYRFQENGILAKYPFRSEKLFSWDVFQEICIVNTAFTTRGERRANTVICLVIKGEKKDIHGRWKTENPFRYKTVICLHYRPELAQGLRCKCPYDVLDLRETPAYRIK